MLRAAEERSLDRPVFVALDVETTGLDRANDRSSRSPSSASRVRKSTPVVAGTTVAHAWPEIAADGHRAAPIEDQPSFAEVRETVREKLGASVVGHSVDFDTDMLASAGLRLANRSPTPIVSARYFFMACRPTVSHRLRPRSTCASTIKPGICRWRAVFLTIIPLIQRYCPRRCSMLLATRPPPAGRKRG